MQDYGPDNDRFDEEQGSMIGRIKDGFMRKEEFYISDIDKKSGYVPLDEVFKDEKKPVQYPSDFSENDQASSDGFKNSLRYSEVGSVPEEDYSVNTRIKKRPMTSKVKTPLFAYILLALCFIGETAGLVMLMNEGESWASIFYMTLLTFCFIVFAASNPKRRILNMILYMVGVGGFSACVWSMYNNYPEAFLKISDNLGSFVVLQIFRLMGLSIAIIPFLMYLKRRKSCTYKVAATVVDIGVVGITAMNSTASYTATPCVQYYYDGVKYLMQGAVSENFVEKPAIGSVIPIYINPDDPEQFQDPPREKKMILPPLGVGFFFYFLTTIFAVTSEMMYLGLVHGTINGVQY